MEVLPKTVDYSEPMGVIPAGTENIHCTCYPVNGGGPFQQGQQIIVDLNNVGYLDPASLSIRYKMTLTTPLQAAAHAAGVSYSIAGCPVYAPILRMDTLFNSNVVESINNYNSVATALSNLEWSVADKQGLASGLGYNSSIYTACSVAGALSGPVDASMIPENTDGLTVVVANAAATTGASTLVYSFSAPLPSLLSNAEKLVPLNGTNIRLQFTLDALANVCPSAITQLLPYTTAAGSTVGGAVANAGAFASYAISCFEVVYNQVQFPPHIERRILDMPKLRIKTSSYATGLQSLGAGLQGTVNLVYNLRYASIKAMFLLMGSSSANSVNKLLESIDISSGSGSYNFQVNGTYYPQNPLSTLNNRSGVLVELRRAMQDLYANNNTSMSIDAAEFAATDASVNAAATTVACPAKFYVGVNTSKISSHAMYSGISSQNSPITAIINIGAGGGGAAGVSALTYSPILMLYYDAIIEIDTQTKQVNYIY